MNPTIVNPHATPTNGHNAAATTSIESILSLTEQVKLLQAKIKAEKEAAKKPVWSPSTEVTEYQGKPMLKLKRHDGFEKYPFQFGINKAVLILALMDDIKKFVESNAVAVAAIVGKDDKTIKF